MYAASSLESLEHRSFFIVLKTRKTLRMQHELIKMFTLKMIAEDLKEKVDKCKESGEEEKPQEKKEK